MEFIIYTVACGTACFLCLVVSCSIVFTLNGFKWFQALKSPENYRGLL